MGALGPWLGRWGRLLWGLARPRAGPHAARPPMRRRAGHGQHGARRARQAGACVWEGGLPYALRVACEGIIETLGSTTFGRGPAGRGAVWTAHPREDASTGELIAVNYYIAAAPHAEVVTVSAGGAVTTVVPIRSMPRPAMIHDAAITERFVVVLDGPLRFDPAHMVRAGTLPFAYHPEQPLRIGLLRRGDDTDGRMAWFSAPNGFIFHTVAAWEAPDRETVTLVACTFDRVDLSFDAGPTAGGVLTRYDLHLPSGA
eukprot:TRINITY_DN4090_c0_g1_i1.p1 TRINITY_DN4090_c0_g1~~TRINITY_DN4090_c0_g1_i1.p1  ORF type:complete len:257 (-),score=57.75 TRINITY_DN4090_c0_g1_i1:542-1312(-)